MRKLTMSCLFFIMIGFPINAKDLNDNEVSKKEAHEKAFIRSVEFEEIDYEFESNTDLLKYLPNDFNPYEGMIIDISEIEFLEEVKPINLGFNTKDYLPENFNPYKGQ